MSALVKKWEKTGLLQGLDMEYDRAICARAFEQAVLMLSSYGQDIEKAASYLFPVIRKTVPALLETEQEIDFEEYVRSCILLIQTEMTTFDFKQAKRNAGDPEIEFCKMVSDKLIEQYKGV